ncbi:hypothetical protein [Streptomyces sp. NPDC049879]|uniref:hypothetical protein n=1 Tax=Streptomyces sp. NPDC049879 TaxID=3365598 RepID=UPI0037911B99
MEHAIRRCADAGRSIRPVVELGDYARLVLDGDIVQDLDVVEQLARLDALADMWQTGAITPDDLAVTAWIGQDIEDEDDRRGYEEEPESAVGRRYDDDGDDACPVCLRWQCICPPPTPDGVAGGAPLMPGPRMDACTFPGCYGTGEPGSACTTCGWMIPDALVSWVR